MEEQVSYAEGQNRPPKNLRMVLKSPTMLSPVQVDEFVALVDKNGGFPAGVPAAREQFREMYEDNGRSWIPTEDE